MDTWEIYVQEARTQIDFAERSWVAFLDAEKRSSVEEIFLSLQHFLGHAAIVHRILCPRESSKREQVLSSRLDLCGIDIEPFRKLRNHLEHFDERLDKWVAKYQGEPFFDMNIVTETRGFPKVAFLRALDGHIYKFHGEDYDLEQLHRALLTIRQRLSAKKSVD